jgi:Tol biopolymer transport system component
MDGDYSVIGEFASKIVFLNENDFKVKIMSEDGSEINTLADLSQFDRIKKGEVAYLEEIKKIGFIGGEDTGKTDSNGDIIYDDELYTVNINNGGLTQITDTEDSFKFGDAEPGNWVADGLLFMSYPNDNFDQAEIYKADVLKEEIVQITNNDRLDGMPFLSPDGKQILFASVPEGETYDLSDPSNLGIYVMNADGTGRTKVINIDNSETPGAWASNNRIILRSYNQNTGETKFYFIDIDGNNQEEITSKSVKDLKLSPNQDKLLYRVIDDSDHNNEDTIYVMNDGMDKQLIGTGEMARWSAGGDKVVYFVESSPDEIREIGIDNNESSTNLLEGENFENIIGLEVLFN